MAGLIAHAKERVFGPEDCVIFLHTGGVFGMLGQAQEIVKLL